MTRLPLRALGWSLNFLGVAVTITLAVWPDARASFLRHSGVGWSFVIALAVTTAALGQLVYHQHRSSVHLATTNDARLLAEWLGDWKQNSEITDFFRHNFLVFSIEQRIALDIDRHVRSWQDDRRQLSDATLREKFSLVRNAATEFSEATAWSMFENGGDRYELPREWRDGGNAADKAKYDDAHNAIEKWGALLFTSLTDLFSAMHDRGLPT